MQISQARKGPSGLTTSRSHTPDSNATLPSQTGNFWACTITPMYIIHLCSYPQPDRVLLGLKTSRHHTPYSIATIPDRVILGLHHHAHVIQSTIKPSPARHWPPGLTPSRPRTPVSNTTIPIQLHTPDNNSTIPSLTGYFWD